MSRPTVVHLMRSVTAHAYSAESIARLIRESLSGYRFVVHHNWFSRPHPFGMIVDLLRAALVRGDVFHVTGDCGYLALALPGRRTVLTVLDCATYHRTRGFRRWLYGLVWIRLPVRRAGRVVVISECVRREVLEITGAPPEKVCVVYCSIHPDFAVQPYTAPPPHGGSPVILQIGTTANKNIERVAEALDGLECKFVVVGRLSESQREALARHRVIYEAHERLSVEEVIALYLRADVVVFASTSEGFGLPVIEGQACGRPVVASNIPVHREIAGNSACLVDPRNVLSIRAGIDRVLGDHRYRHELIRLGRINARRFEVLAMVSGYEAAYRQVASPDPS